MSQTFHRASTGDTITVPDVLAPNYQANPDWQTGAGPARPGDVVELKGAELDSALESAGLSKSGTVAEKRDRLTAYANEKGNS